MAKYGEGDKRWIVEDRADGANVHNWHWAERDCLEWSRSLLSALLQGITILGGEGGLVIKTTTLDKLEGEAYVNIRKGKIIPGYELSLSLAWEGEVVGTAGDSTLAKVTGTLDVPYLADENADEDPEVKVTVRDDDGPVGKRIRDALLVKGKALVQEKIREYVKAMAQGGPAKDDVEVKKPKALPKQGAAPTAVAPVSGNTGATVPAARKTEADQKQQKKRKEGFKTITMTQKFSCRARDIYEILMDENRWKGFTQSNAKISREVGGEFSIFDGSVTGTHVELQEAKLIVQKWRFASWTDGIYSQVKLAFDEPEPGMTIVKLTQTDVPEEDRYGNATVVENTERGWRDLIFHKIRAVFGFGI